MEELEVAVAELHLVAAQGAVAGAALVDAHRADVDVAGLGAVPGQHHGVAVVEEAGVVAEAHDAGVGVLAVDDVAVDQAELPEVLQVGVAELVVPRVGHVVPRRAGRAAAAGVPGGNGVHLGFKMVSAAAGDRRKPRPPRAQRDQRARRGTVWTRMLSLLVAARAVQRSGARRGGGRYRGRARIGPWPTPPRAPRCSRADLVPTASSSRPSLLARVPPEGAAADPDEILDRFLDWVAEVGLELYPAQEEALLELMAGKHVILNTPTGSGKSLVALGLHFKAAVRGADLLLHQPDQGAGVGEVLRPLRRLRRRATSAC